MNTSWPAELEVQQYSRTGEGGLSIQRIEAIARCLATTEALPERVAAAFDAHAKFSLSLPAPTNLILQLNASGPAGKKVIEDFLASDAGRVFTKRDPTTIRLLKITITHSPATDPTVSSPHAPLTELVTPPTSNYADEFADQNPFHPILFTGEKLPDALGDTEQFFRLAGEEITTHQCTENRPLPLALAIMLNQFRGQDSRALFYGSSPRNPAESPYAFCIESAKMFVPQVRRYRGTDRGVFVDMISYADFLYEILRRATIGTPSQEHLPQNVPMDPKSGLVKVHHVFGSYSFMPHETRQRLLNQYFLFANNPVCRPSLNRTWDELPDEGSGKLIIRSKDAFDALQRFLAQPKGLYITRAQAQRLAFGD